MAHSRRLSGRLAFCLLAAAAFLPRPAEASASKLDARLQILKSSRPEERPVPGRIAALEGEAPQPSVNVFIRFQPGFGKSYLQSAYPQAQFRTELAGIVTARVPISILEALEADAHILAIEHSQRLDPKLDVVRSNATSSGLFLGVLQSGLSDLANVDGTGVIVGVVDTGIDWKHKDFIVEGSPNKSRILYIWDQTDSADASHRTKESLTVDYGAQWTKAEIDNEIDGSPAGIVRQKDTDGHGTHVAGIAAGDGSDTNENEPAGKYAGMAPKADIIAVQIPFGVDNEDNIVDAMSYIVSRAQALGKRAVINLSLGGQAGPHDGTSMFDTQVAAIAASTPVVVAMGNEQAKNPHARANFAPADTNTFIVARFVSTHVVVAEFWHPAGDSYSATVTLTCSPACGGSVSAPAGTTASGAIGSATVQIVNATYTGHPLGDRPIEVKVTQSPSLTATRVNYQLTRTSNGGSGRVDGFTYPDSAGFTGALLDPTLTVASPATANNVIAVAAYISKNTWKAADGLTYEYSPAISLGQIASFSNRGPTRDGRQKPDVAAPGQGISSSLSAESSPNSAFKLFDGRHRINQGTSQAAPVVTGAIALQLQVNPGASVSAIRSAVQSTARSDSAVTAAGSVPNNLWGYGKLLGAPKVASAPQQLAATTLGTSSISWTWSLVANATAYHVYYATSTSTRIAAVSTNAFAFENLAPNFFTGIIVKGANAIGEGTASAPSSTSTLALPIQGTPSATPAISSITVSYTPCPSSPSSASCSGYILNASTAANFSGVIHSSATANRAAASLQVSGLSEQTTYYLRLGTLNASNGANFAVLGSTRTLPLLPQAALDFSARTLGISSITWTWSAILGANSYNIYYATSQASLIASVDSPSFTFTGLESNFRTVIFVRGVNASGEGTGATSPSTATLSLPVSGASVSATSSSTITVAYTPCPASPTSASCSGYVLHASTAADFSGTVLSSASASRLQPSLRVASLNSLTTYYLRLATLNLSNGANFASLGSTHTATGLLAPAAAAFTELSSTAIQMNWQRGSNPAGLDYLAEASTASNFSGNLLSLQGSDIFSALFSGLSANTTYHFRVKAVGGPTLEQGPLATLAAPPQGLSPPFSGIASTQLTFGWSAAGNPAGTLYSAQISLASDFSSMSASSQTKNTTAVFSSLSVNATYYARVAAVNHGGTVTSFSVSAATSTSALPPAAGPFSGQSSGGFTASFTDGGNPAGTLYLARISTASNFSAIGASIFTTNTTATFTGLIANELYHSQAAAISRSGAATSFFSAVSTATLPASPASVPAVASNRTTSGLRLAWGASGNASATQYLADISDDPGFGVVAQSATTGSLFADFTGLSANTTYYLRAKSISLHSPNPDSPLAALGGASTLAQAPSAAAQTFLSVTLTSMTVQWTPLASSPQSAAAEGYRLEASTDSNFGGTLFSNTVAGGSALQGGIAGLTAATTYYLRVGSLNWNSVANYAALGSTRTPSAVASAQPVTGSGLSLNLAPAYPEIRTIAVDIPAGALPAGTLVTLNASVSFELPPPRSNQARLQSLGAAVGFNLSAGGLQPTGPVRVVLAYDPLLLPPGVSPRNLQLARYDEASAQWTLLPTFVDAANSLLVSQVSHFSLFAPFAVSAAPDLDSVSIFPIPWEPGSGHALFDAPVLTITNLTDGAKVRIFTLTGELVWEATAGPTGVLTWPGNNRFGRQAGSGTYLVAVEGGGRRVLRRAVIIR